MRVNCISGYFIFDETKAGQISAFASRYGFEIVRNKNHFTFSSLADAPRFAVAGGTWLDAPITVTCEGEPWDIMRLNGLVYNFILDQVVPIPTVTQLLFLSSAANYYFSSGLILPASIRDDGKRVTDYAGWFLHDSARFKYSEVSYE